ncbi:LLM class flavin-dependent oxidoreductase [Microlunatus speluncae]|uniref:LLM class flavin-dependent oxidoreductase n=1 Tax=Microlunatus speluncae TaxID=2594267 RepID=UPI00126623E0|nr:LLM class flavin-dependent oxidoreductase [Microlunatus speluncae]
MRSGLAISPIGPWGEPQRIAELAALAEDSGWDGIFCEEYLIRSDGMEAHDVWLTLALVAQATSRVTLGTMVTPLAWRQPWTVAAQAVTLDRISGGRCVLGVGSGDGDVESRLSEINRTPGQLAETLDRRLAVIDRLWSGRNGPILNPGPVQRPRIPVWVGGAITRPGPRSRALRWDGSCLYRLPPPDWQDVTAEDVASLRSDADAAGKPDFTICVGGRQRADDRAADLRYLAGLEAAGADWWTEYVPPTLSYSEARALIKGGPLRP